MADVLTDEEYSSLQNALIKDPEPGDLIPGSGGIRKLRWGVAGRGKRGVTRVSTTPEFAEDKYGCLHFTQIMWWKYLRQLKLRQIKEEIDG